jgi:hypothetical protein
MYLTPLGLVQVPVPVKTDNPCIPWLLETKLVPSLYKTWLVVTAVRFNPPFEIGSVPVVTLLVLSTAPVASNPAVMLPVAILSALIEVAAKSAVATVPSITAELVIFLSV